MLDFAKVAILFLIYLLSDKDKCLWIQYTNIFSFVLFFDSTQRKKEGLNLSTQNCQGQGYVGRVVDIFSNWFCQNPLLHCIAICCFEREDPQIVPKFSLSRFVHFKRGPEDILEEMLYASWFMFLILHMRRVPTSIEVDLRSTTKVGRFSYNLSIFLSSLCLHRHFWIYACFKAIARCLEHQYHLPAGEYLGFNVMYTMTNTKVIFSGNSCFNFFLKNCLHLNNQLKLTYNLLPGNSLT